MTTSTVLLLLLSIIAAGLSFYQYLYKVKNQSKWYWFWLFTFISLLSVFYCLLIQLSVEKIIEIKKTPLPIVVDNSKSISELKATKEASSLYRAISENKAITEKYDVQLFSFAEEFQSLEKLDFKGNQSHIDGVAKM